MTPSLRLFLALTGLLGHVAAQAPNAATHPKPFTEILRDAAGIHLDRHSHVVDLWELATEHPMTVAIAAGTVPEPAMVEYLIQDHKFLDAFVVLLASMIAHAPTLADRVPGAQFLALITGKENTYFERSFAALGVSVSDREQPASPVAAKFIELMRSAATSGDVGQMLAVLVAAEWSYLEWGERVQVAKGAPFWCSEWVDLHRGDGFRGVVTYLRGLLDQHALTVSPEGRRDISRTFLKAVQLEVDFWDAAWGVASAKTEL